MPFQIMKGKRFDYLWYLPVTNHIFFIKVVKSISLSIKIIILIMNHWILGIPATICPSIPHSLFPLLILKNPLFPQSSFQELATSQYGVPLSTPQPTILMAWPPKADPVVWW